MAQGLMDGFFSELKKTKAVAIILHRGADGLPNFVTVPPDFSPEDVVACVRSFGFDADLGEVYDSTDPELGDYATVTLVDVREFIPEIASRPKLVVHARRIIRDGLRTAAKVVEALAKKV